jgi:type IV secretion system protein VirB10
MFPRANFVFLSTLAFFSIGSVAASTDADRDFSGVWLLDAQRSDVRLLPAPPGATLTIGHQGLKMHCLESDKDGISREWIYHTDGTASKYPVGDARMSSMTKWEGTALLINTIVSGPQSYVIDDRWRLSHDHNSLTIKRRIQRGFSGTEIEAVLIYRSQHPNPTGGDRPSDAAPTAPPRTEPPPEIVVPAGTKIPLGLVNTLSTKHSGEGDRVYLETVFPVTIDGRIVIPRGSYVAGTVTEVKRPGRVKGKGELFLRFDSLTLPNGITRDFRSRLGGADSEAGEFDRKEGRIRSDSNKGEDARTVAKTTSAGAAVGGIAGGAASHAGMGAGIGAAAGAAAGLASVLLSRGPDLVLPKGTSFEMVLDRTLRFKPSELF